MSLTFDFELWIDLSRKIRPFRPAFSLQKRVRTAGNRRKSRRKMKDPNLKMCKSQNRRSDASSFENIVLTRGQLHNWLLFRDLNRCPSYLEYRPIGLFLEVSGRLFSIPQAFPQAIASPPKPNATACACGTYPQPSTGFAVAGLSLRKPGRPQPGIQSGCNVSGKPFSLCRSGRYAACQ